MGVPWGNLGVPHTPAPTLCLREGRRGEDLGGVGKSLGVSGGFWGYPKSPFFTQERS